MEHDTRRESDRLLGQLRRALRAELMSEFRLEPPAPALPPTVVTLELELDRDGIEAARRRGEAHVVVYKHMAQRTCRPFRLCFDPATTASTDVVLSARVGIEPVLELRSGGIPARAFPPIPPWLLEPVVDVERLRKVARDFADAWAAQGAAGAEVTRHSVERLSNTFAALLDVLEKPAPAPSSELERAARDFPLGNIRPVTAGPGLVFSLIVGSPASTTPDAKLARLDHLDPAGFPRPWLLAHVPAAESLPPFPFVSAEE